MVCWCYTEDAQGHPLAQCLSTKPTNVNDAPTQKEEQVQTLQARPSLVFLMYVKKSNEAGPV